jgi:hypothetical protein
MSSAFYPLGMRPSPSSGYNHNSSFPQQYVTWKGTGLSQTPVGITAGTIRPLTNKDYGNNAVYGSPFDVYVDGKFVRRGISGFWGKARPIKHARKGAIPRVAIEGATSYQEYIQMDRNINREVKSSSQGTLVKQMIDNPGGYSVKQNTLLNLPSNCQGICVSANLYPNIPYLTENPEPVSTSPGFCCNPEKKARRRVLPASTKLKQNYYTTHIQYMENRCKTYEQRAFNFVRPAIPFSDPDAKPGSPAAEYNTYVANCQPNGEIYTTSEAALVAEILLIMQNEGVIASNDAAKLIYKQITTFKTLVTFIQNLPEPNKNSAIVIYDAFVLNPYTGVPITGPTDPLACKLVVYKPNNAQFAQQGAVSSSTLNLKLNVTTIEKNLAHLPRNIILKNKAQIPCQAGNYIRTFQNPRMCHQKTNDIVIYNNSPF